MVKRFVVPFAATGDKTVTPDATDPSGAISYSQGWGAQYQLPDSDPAYRPVGRQEMNGVLNDITGALGEIQQMGVAEWVAPGGLVPPYPINALVRHNDINYVSTVANNSTTPGAVGATWNDISDIKGRLLGVRRITATQVNTPTPGTKFCVVKLCGGGGGAGGAPATGVGQASVSSGGGGGSYSEGIFFTGFAGITVTIGTGGVGGTGVSGAVGQASSFGTLLTAPGGAAGSSAGPSPSAFFAAGSQLGSIGTGGNIFACSGGSSMYSTVLSPNTLQMGVSGSSMFGYGYSGVVGLPGTNASAYGVGGGPTALLASAAALKGGNGAPGVAIIWDFS